MANVGIVGLGFMGMIHYLAYQRLRGVKVASSLLAELFEDQVNIVQTQLAGRRHSVLLTASDGHRARSIL